MLRGTESLKEREAMNAQNPHQRWTSSSKAARGKPLQTTPPVFKSTGDSAHSDQHSVHCHDSGSSVLPELICSSLDNGDRDI